MPIVCYSHSYLEEILNERIKKQKCSQRLKIIVDETEFTLGGQNSTWNVEPDHKNEFENVPRVILSLECTKYTEKYQTSTVFPHKKIILC